MTSEGIHHPFSMTLFEDNLFWSDWITGAIYAINKFTGQNRKIVHDGLMMPKGVAIMHPLRQPKSGRKGTCRECNMAITGDNAWLPNVGTFISVSAGSSLVEWLVLSKMILKCHCSYSQLCHKGRYYCSPTQFPVALGCYNWAIG